MNNSKLIYGVGLIALALAVFFLATRVRGKFHFGDDTHWGPPNIVAVDSFNIIGIKQLSSQGTANVIIIPSDDERVVFYYNKDEVENLSEVKDSVLFIDFKNDNSHAFSFRKSKHINVKVYTHSIQDIEQEGVGSINGQGLLAHDNISLSNQGVGSMEFEVQCKNIHISNGGVGSIELKGTTENAEIMNEGTGSIDAEKMISKDAKATNQGIGSISLNASGTMDLTNQGVGSIEYSGEGTVTGKHSQGIGSIKKK